MTVADEDLWNSLDVALTLKRTRDATLVRFNELVRKRFPELPERCLTQENCELRRELLTATQLQRFNPGHTRDRPRQMTGPVVAWEYGNESYMLDGTTRLNAWLRDGDTNEHETIIMKRRDESSDG
jgi:hypothetical protein